MANSIFDVIGQTPDDPILGLNEAFKKDPRTQKVNLTAGVYSTEEGKIPLLSVVLDAEKAMVADPQPRGYIGMTGIPSYCAAVQKLLFGAECPAIAEGRIVTCQSLGGTGAIKVGADLLSAILPGKHKAVISSPTWPNHKGLFAGAGFEVGNYRYFDAARNDIDADGMIADIEALEPNTVVVLHACCHNPTGLELSAEQWDRVVAAVAKSQAVPFLDIAYQGFGNGLLEDTVAVRKFLASGLTMFVSSSFSKSFSLYGERVGALSVVCRDKEEAKRVTDRIKLVVRTNYSNPPRHGAMCVSMTLNDPAKFKIWEGELAEMRERIKKMRRLLVQKLGEYGVAKDMSYIVRQGGMFSFTGLTPAQVDRLREEYGIYAVRSGRICVASLNTHNIDYVAKCWAEVVK